MRALLTRVSSASVAVDASVVGAIGRGVLVLVGLCKDDTEEDAAYVTQRILACRLFESPDNGKAWRASVASLGLPVLLVPQFTLHAQTRKPQPDFHASMPADVARGFWDRFVSGVRAAHGADRVATGVFQAMMSVSSVNEGPVTLMVDSKNKDDVRPSAATPAASAKRTLGEQRQEGPMQTAGRASPGIVAGELTPAPTR